jgi:cytoskeleton protein RodZ
MQQDLATETAVNTSTTAALSAESVQTFLHQIEAQLLSSDTYHQVLTALQTKLGTVAEEFQSLLSALSREAIQYTLQQLMGQVVNAKPEAEEAVLDDPIVSPIVAEPVTQPTSREAILLQLGQDFQQQRQAKGLSLQELHTQTYVPLHHLKALEEGQLDKLPEDIYIRGFVRQIGNALGMNGVKLAATIPIPEAAKRVVPSWQQKAAFKPIAQLSPVHLYVGYAALMAGAVGGLTWISSQPADKTPMLKANMGIMPAQQMSQAAALAHPNVAPPETLHIR